VIRAVTLPAPATPALPNSASAASARHAPDGVLVEGMRCRRAASACGVFANNALDPADRALLLRLQQSWLTRACHADAIDDMPPRPPVGSRALQVPKRA
jgi:hypothetical protein